MWACVPPCGSARGAPACALGSTCQRARDGRRQRPRWGATQSCVPASVCVRVFVSPPTKGHTRVPTLTLSVHRGGGVGDGRLKRESHRGGGAGHVRGRGGWVWGATVWVRMPAAFPFLAGHPQPSRLRQPYPQQREGGVGDGGRPTESPGGLRASRLDAPHSDTPGRAECVGAEGGEKPDGARGSAVLRTQQGTTHSMAR